MAKGILILLALLAASASLLTVADASCAEGQDALLIDFGNGHTEWSDLQRGGTIESAVSLSIGGRAAFADSDSGRILVSVDGVSGVVVGKGAARQACGWRIYAWNSVEWEFLTSDASDRYAGGPIALGYYPKDSVVPVSSPDCRDVWTSFRGDSSSSGVSTSSGPGRVAAPLEWSSTYAGAVDASVLYADGMIYHTVAGRYGAVGTDGLARVCCLDPVNKEVLWSVTYSNSGNTEITTPVIVGGLIIVTSGNWHVYCLDRFTGEPVAELAPSGEDGDMCRGSMLSTYIPRKGDESVRNDRIHLEGGMTNAVYDSGVLYFGTSDGILRCFSVDREDGFREIWNHVPASDVRGCFYYHPPVVCDHGGAKRVLIGNYGGGLVCVDGLTGSGLWSQKVTDASGKAVGQVTSITVCEGGRALVCYSGGEMSSAGGGIMLIDVEDGSVVWKEDVRCGRPAVFGDRFYSYVSALPGQTVKDSSTGAEVPLESGYCSMWVDDCSLLWLRQTDALSIGGVSYCGGRVYSMDYSPGTEGANGGWVWCLDADTGSVVWKCQVSPYSGNSYSMCSPTVVDGRVLVGNDYGAVYVLSEKSGSERSQSSEIDYRSEGLAHPSWIAFFVLVAAVIAVSVHAYRR